MTGTGDRNFLSEWNALPGADRRRLRRLVRLGRPIEAPQERALAAEYATFQRSRPWIRWFWFWFVPGMLFALSIATRSHPIVIGVVLALGAQAVLGWYNLRRYAPTNL